MVGLEHYDLFSSSEEKGFNQKKSIATGVVDVVVLTSCQENLETDAQSLFFPRSSLTAACPSGSIIVETLMPRVLTPYDHILIFSHVGISIIFCSIPFIVFDLCWSYHSVRYSISTFLFMQDV
jgi:hypothetical protein